MQQYKISNRLLRHFGVNKMGFYWSETCDDRKEFIKEMIIDNQMLAIVGDVGVGKSTLMEKVRGELSEEVTFIYAEDPHKERMAIGTILNDVIDKISSESLRRSRAARKTQFTRIVGRIAVQEKRKVCIVIEEAHRLHHQLFRSLKELREAEYLGVAPLFSVVLIGHPMLEYKLRRMREAYLRSHILQLSEVAGWLNYDERIEFLRAIFGRAIKPSVRKRIATVYRYPLEMLNYVETKMWEAYKAGKNTLDDEVVQPTPRELYDALKASYPDAISYKIIADEIQAEGKYIGKTTISDVLAKGNDHPKSKIVMKAMEKISARQEKQLISKVG